MLTVLDTTDQLADLVAHLPVARLEFDLGHLASATITTPSAADPLAHMSRFDGLAAAASTVRVLSNVI